MPNLLIHEGSPYLLQHAHNPVDWFPWGPEALERARAEDRPILLSVGYSACHWCHVMERESFQDPETAAVLNERFISVKVDREERPDLDSVYMQAVQALAGHGGWPMTVFLTPDLKPFFGGTYFPPEDRGGLPGFRRVLLAVSDAFRERRREVAESAERLTSLLRGASAVRLQPSALEPGVLERATAALSEGFDQEHGGFGAAPKFPQPMTLEHLLRYAHRTGAAAPRAMVEQTLDRMARGGIYDHLGGGFHRYATDDAWRLPHFEKMLYDNALLPRLYLHAFQATGHAEYRRVVEETLDYLLGEMQDPSGGFYTSQDADSEGQEGAFYLWDQQGVVDALGPEDGPLLYRYLGVTPEGDLDGLSVLHTPGGLESLAAAMGIPVREAEERAARGRAVLLDARRRRAPPALDDKVLTGWSGLALGSLAEAAAVLGRDDYLEAAAQCARFLLASLREEGRLLRAYRDCRARGLGYLEDYAFLVDGLIHLYEASFHLPWLLEAQALADEMLGLFWDQEVGGFYDTGRDHEGLVARPRELSDGATPCGSSAATLALLRLGALTGVPRYREHALLALRGVCALLGQHPAAFGHWLCALDFALGSPREVVIVGDRGEADTRALLEALHGGYVPNKVVAGIVSEDDPDAEALGLLEGRSRLGGRATAYVCQDFACQMPVTEPEALVAQLVQRPLDPR